MEVKRFNICPFCKKKLDDVGRFRHIVENHKKELDKMLGDKNGIRIRR